MGIKRQLLYVLFLLPSVLAVGDSVTIDGKTYSNVEIRESARRYYIKILSQNRTISLRKDEIDPSDIQLDPKNAYDEPVAATAQTQEAVPEGVRAPLQAGVGTVLFSPLTPNDDRLEINALVLHAGEEWMAFCSVDTCAFDGDFFRLVTAKLKDSGSAIGKGNLMLGATHTYTSSFTGLVRGPIGEVLFGDYSPEEYDHAATRVVEAITIAEETVRPARILFGETQVPGLNFNRALKGEPVDETVSVARIEGRDGTPITYLVNYAAQPTVLLDKAPELGRDFPGGIATTLRRACGSVDLPVVFFNGAMADVGPKPPSGQTPTEKAFFMGKAIAEAALDAVKDGQAQDLVELRTNTRVVELPPHLLTKFIPKATVLQDFWIDDTVFLSIPGEASSAIGMALRKKAVDKGAKGVFLVGPANDYGGYHMDVKGYYEAQYEATLSFYGPLIISWYLDQHLPALILKPSEPWIYSKMIADNRQEFERSRDEAKNDAETIGLQWKVVDDALSGMHKKVKKLRPMPEEALKILDKVPSEDAIEIGKQYLAYYVRHEKVQYSDAQRTRLMGIADGAALPFDAIMLLQYLATPGQMDESLAAIFGLLNVKGIDFLKIGNG